MATRSTKAPSRQPGAQKLPPIVIPSDPLARQRRKLELKRRLAVLRDAERLEQSFKAFVVDAWPVIEPGRPLAWNWHLDVLCETLEAIARGEVRRCVINVPPRTMKSTLFNVMFPAWVWTFRASYQFLNISTDADLAMRDSTVSRVIIQSDWYQQRWGRRFRFSADQNQKSWYKNDQNGHRQALGMTSKITGKGADCLPAGTMVTTEQGDIDIADLVRLLDPPRVLSFNHETGATEWRRVVASREVVADGLVEVESVCGRKVRSTRDHRFYVEGRGYRPAQDLASADGVVGIAEVRGMQRPGDGRVDAMPRLLPENAEGDSRPTLLKLFGGVRQTVLRIREDVAARRRGCLLLKILHGIGAQGHLCNGQIRAQGGEVAAHLNAQAARQNVSAMRCAVSANIQPDSALLAGLCGQGTFSAHGRAWQRALQGWAILRQMVRSNAPANLGAGWRSMRRLWCRGVLDGRDNWKTHREAVQSGRPPHQRGCSGQYAREPDRSLPAVSHGAPQIEGDAVRLVRPVHCGKVVVYDIQVEGTHNFFANGILVHNCIIIDDPHNVSGAQSDAERKADTSKYDNEIQNRLNDQSTGSIIIIMQRLHEQDLTGHVLPRGGWLHLCFPMEYDAALATEGVDERTEHGTLLWPERFPRRSIDELKASMTPYAYSGQYQQRPTPAEGGILKRAWWQAWPKERALPPCAFIIQCWDGAFDAKTAGDFTACTVWGVFKNEQTHRHNLILLERFRQRVEFPDLRMRAKELYDRHDADLVLIEPKATGKPLVQELRRVGVPVQEWQPERGAKGREVDKTARTHAAAIVPWGGAVWYPTKKTGEPFSWVNEVIEECASFPNAAHDDLVDTCTMAWLYLRRSWWADLSDEEVDERKDEEEEAFEDDKIRSYG